jgi:hypothetical protein
MVCEALADGGAHHAGRDDGDDRVHRGSSFLTALAGHIIYNRIH